MSERGEASGSRSSSTLRRCQELVSWSVDQLLSLGVVRGDRNQASRLRMVGPCRARWSPNGEEKPKDNGAAPTQDVPMLRCH